MLSSTPNKRITYVRTLMGKFVTEVPPETPEARRRVKKNGKEVWELVGDELAGYIDQIEYKKSEFDGITYRSLIIRLHSTEGHFQLELDVMGAEASSFFHVLPNIDPALPVLFRIWINKEDRTSFVVYQGGQPLKWAYTKQDPKGRPDWEKKEALDIDGNLVTKWDRTKQVQFFINLLPVQAERFYSNWTKNQPEPATKQAAPPSPFADKKPILVEPAWQAADPTDDLPF
jgi:hypothetical protein